MSDHQANQSPRNVMMPIQDCLEINQSYLRSKWNSTYLYISCYFSLYSLSSSFHILLPSNALRMVLAWLNWNCPLSDLWLRSETEFHFGWSPNKFIYTTTVIKADDGMEYGPRLLPPLLLLAIVIRSPVVRWPLRAAYTTTLQLIASV